MTAGRLREWRGVKPVPGPSGAAITTHRAVDWEAGRRVIRAIMAKVCMKPWTLHNPHNAPQRADARVRW